MFKRIIISKHLRRRISLLVVIVITLPLAIFFSATGRSSRGPGGIAGVMFGKRISWDTFQEHQAWILEKLGDQAGDIPPELLQTFLAQETWNALLLVEEAKRQRLRVEDTELAVVLHNEATFQEDGRFVPERYRWYLAQRGLSPETFETWLRRDLLIQKLLTTVRASVAVTDDEVTDAYATAHERLRASLVTVDPASFRTQAMAGLTEELLREEYEAHPELVRIPEQLVVEYAGASRAELLPYVQVTDDDLVAFYEEHRQEFAGAEATPKPFEEVRETIRQQVHAERVAKQLTALALDLQEDVEANRPFEEIITMRALIAHTVGPLPVEPPWSTELPDPAILREVAALGEGQMSEVIQSAEGVYLARVTQRQPARVPPFEEVRLQLQERVVAARAREAARARAQTLRTQLAEDLAAGRSFEEAARARALEALHPAPFTRTEPIDPLGAVPTVNAAAFAVPVGGLTDVVETPGAFVLIVVHEQLPSDAAALAPEERQRLREQLVVEKQQAHTLEWLAALHERAKLQSFLDN